MVRRKVPHHGGPGPLPDPASHQGRGRGLARSLASNPQTAAGTAKAAFSAALSGWGRLQCRSMRSATAPQVNTVAVPIDAIRVLMLGAPGSGKGTQGERLAARHGVPHLSSGELLRVMWTQERNSAGAAQDAMQRGDLIADELVITMVRQAVLRPGASNSFVLDGFPRTMAQATAAYEIARRLGITFHAVALLDIPYDQLITRLAARRARVRSSRRRRGDDPPPHRRLPGQHAAARRLLLRSRHPVRVDATGSIDEVSARVFDAIDAQLAKT